MLGIRLDPKLEKRLERPAKETGRSKSYYAKLAIQQFLQDREDLTEKEIQVESACSEGDTS